MSEPTGNGESQYEVVANHTGDKVILSLSRLHQLPDHFPLALVDSLHRWLAEHPTHRVRTALPIVMQGNTVQLHVWLDET